MIAPICIQPDKFELMWDIADLKHGLCDRSIGGYNATKFD